MFVALVLIGPILGAAAFLLPRRGMRLALLPAGAAAHLALTLAALPAPAPAPGALLGLDPAGTLVLVLTDGLFLACSVYALGYLRERPDRDDRVFVACMLGFLGAASLAALARHLGLLWVAVESATLLGAPLVHFGRRPASVEATWKYLMVCGAGASLALLGTFFLAYAGLGNPGGGGLGLDALIHSAPGLSRTWLRLAYAFLLVGYGTKMGLAPLHTWKPDAYGEAPGVAGTLLAGVLTSTAFLALLRVRQVCVAAGPGAGSGTPLVVLGLASMAVAGVFIVGQRDLKRLLAYSSVENMGVLAVGLGLGGAGVFAACLHMVFAAVAEGAMFLCAGNIQRVYGSKHLDEVRGAWRLLPWSGGMLTAGFFAVTGSPPFAPFVSEFTLLSAALRAGRPWVAGLLLAFSMLAFLGLGRAVLAAVLDSPPAGMRRVHEGAWTTLPPLALLAVAAGLGLWMPPALRGLAQGGAALLAGRP